MSVKDHFPDSKNFFYVHVRIIIILLYHGEVLVSTFNLLLSKAI